MRKFYVLGINYKKINLKEREKFIQSKPQEKIKKMLHNGIIAGYVMLATCLRVEFYIETKNIDVVLKNFEYDNNSMYLYNSKEAIKYLFSVVCGFDSIIIGEDQILSQVKSSYINSLSEKYTTTLLNVIFNNAISLGKKFRTVSKIGYRALSLENIALKFIKNHFKSLEKKKVFIIGIGELSQSILFIMKKSGVKNITITNRTHHKTKEIKIKYKVDVVDFHDKYRFINENDIIVSSTSSPHPIIRKKELKNALNDKKRRFFLDLAVPRDIEENIGEDEDIELYNLDDLWEIYNKNLSDRDKVGKEYYYLINEQLEKYYDWFWRMKKAGR